MARKNTVSLRERNKQEKLERIRRSARSLFRQKGFDATTISEIADDAGVAKGTVFLYARDKHDLLFLIYLEDIRAAVNRGFDTLPDVGLIDQVVHLFAQMLQLYSKQPALAILFIREVLVLKGDKLEDYNQITVGFLSRIADLVGAAAERGEVRRDVDTMLVASNLFALYAFSLLSWLQDRKPDVELGQLILRRSFAVMFDGISAPSDAR